MTKQHQRQMQPRQQEQRGRQGGGPQSAEATRTQIAVADTHCGAGCTLGDIAAESWVAVAGLTFAGSVFPTRLVMDFLLAWLFGVIFQYFTIAPLRGLSPGKGILAAIRADTFATSRTVPDRPDDNRGRWLAHGRPRATHCGEVRSPCLAKGRGEFRNNASFGPPNATSC